MNTVWFAHYVFIAAFVAKSNKLRKIQKGFVAVICESAAFPPFAIYISFANGYMQKAATERTWLTEKPA